MGSALRKTKKYKTLSSPSIPLPPINEQRVAYHENKISNISLFADDVDAVQKINISELPYQIDLL